MSKLYAKMCRLQQSTLFTVSHNAMHVALQFSSTTNGQVDFLLLMFADFRNINKGNYSIWKSKD